MATSKKTTARTRAAANDSVKAENRRSKPAAAPIVKSRPELSQRAAQQLREAAAGAIGALPPEFQTDGFEIIGDQVRIFGTVKPPPVQFHGEGIVDAELRKDSEFLSFSSPAPAPISMMPARTSPLQEALHEQYMQISTLSQVLEDLEVALSFVVMPTAPQGNGAAEAAQTRPQRAGVLDVLENHADALQRVISRVRHLTDRVQA